MRKKSEADLKKKQDEAAADIQGAAADYLAKKRAAEAPAAQDGDGEGLLGGTMARCPPRAGKEFWSGFGMPKGAPKRGKFGTSKTSSLKRQKMPQEQNKDSMRVSENSRKTQCKNTHFSFS